MERARGGGGRSAEAVRIGRGREDSSRGDVTNNVEGGEGRRSRLEKCK